MGVVDQWAERVAQADEMEQTYPTEASVGPVLLAIRRSWPSPDGWPSDPDANWYAALDIGPFRNAWDCNHRHTTEEGAWGCAGTALRIVVEKHDTPEHYEWEADDER